MEEKEEEEEEEEEGAVQKIKGDQRETVVRVRVGNTEEAASNSWLS